MTDGLGDRLVDLLRRQARERNVPEWITAALEDGEAPAQIEELSPSTLRISRGDEEEFEIRIQLVTLVAETPARGRWTPSGVPRRALARLSYVVVDEIVGGGARVSVSSWPQIDERGRLRFPEDERPVTVSADAEVLERFLERHARRPKPKPKQGLRMGDVFAAQVRPRKLRELESATVAPPPSAWLVPPVYDVSDAARDKAKEAFYAAVAPTLRPKEADAMMKVEPTTRARR